MFQDFLKYLKEWFTTLYNGNYIASVNLVFPTMDVMTYFKALGQLMDLIYRDHPERGNLLWLPVEYWQRNPPKFTFPINLILGETIL